jgi:hypothetical protein
LSRKDCSDLDEFLPRYVEREIWPQLEEWADRACRDGGFLILVGDSAVGKTRLLYELAAAKLPGFYVLAPTLGDATVINAISEADIPLPPLLIWLDELHRFLPGRYLPEGGTALKASALEVLLKARTPVVFFGTYWPGHSQYFRALSLGSLREPEPQNPAAYQILDNPRVLELRLDSFSEVERRRAALLAAEDPRLADAVADVNYNVTETLAGAPRLMSLYRSGTMTGRAILPAAIDARRIGYAGALSKAMLKAASVDYLKPSELYAGWFDEALHSAIRVDRGASALLDEPGSDSGYGIADYLFQRASIERRSVWAPWSVWKSAIDHTHDMAGLLRLRKSAENRYLYQIARRIVHIMAEHGDRAAQLELINELYKAGNVDGLRRYADEGDLYASRWLVRYLDEHRNPQAADIYAAKLAQAGDDEHVERYIDRLILTGDVDRLRGLVDSGQIYIEGKFVQAARLPTLIRAIRTLLESLQESEPSALIDSYKSRLAELEERCEEEQPTLLEERERRRRELSMFENPELRSLASEGDYGAAEILMERLLRGGYEEEYIALLEEWAESGAHHAAELLAAYYSERRAYADLQRRTSAGDIHAAGALEDLRMDSSDIADLIEEVRVGDPGAQLAENGYAPSAEGEVDEPEIVREYVADCVEEGRVGDALLALSQTLSHYDDPDLAEMLVDLLVSSDPNNAEVPGCLDALRARADTGSLASSMGLVQVFSAWKDVGLLKAELAAGNSLAGRAWSDLLSELGRAHEARALRSNGLTPAGEIMMSSDSQGSVP